eukprot:symbB.v1.2.007925.t1/scaffold495.1/size259991/9
MTGSGNAAPVRLPKGHMTQEEFDALGYPTIPSHWTKEWMLEQIELEKVDPRVNPNLLLEETSQAGSPEKNNWVEFWDNMSRKPYAKAVLKSERHWSKRRNAWLRQFEQVEMANLMRAEMLDELEACSPELKRMLAPIMGKVKVEGWRACSEFNPLIPHFGSGGEAEAQRMLEDFTAETSAALVVDTDTMTKLMNRAQKLRKDGYIAWEQGAVEEAFESWCESEACLFKKRLQEQDVEGNKMINDLHSILLKNIAQAAIKLGHWSDALKAADDALAIDEEDHKAWFRRAGALEGLGRYNEAEMALDRIEHIAVGRADRARQQIAMLEFKHEETEKLALQKALQHGVFAREDDEAELKALEEELKELEAEEAEEAILEDVISTPFSLGDRVVAMENLGDVAMGHEGCVMEVDKDGDIKVLFDGQTEAQLILHVDFDTLAPAGTALPSPATSSTADAPAEKYLTQEGACDLLEALSSAYEDPGFQRQVAKLCRDVRWDVKEFTHHLPKVALEVQKWILPRWGFDPSIHGAQEAETAIAAAKRRATDANSATLQRLSEGVTR